MIVNPTVSGGGEGEYVTATYENGYYTFAFMSPDGISVVEKYGASYQVLKNSICTISSGAKVSGGIKAIKNNTYGIYGYEVTGDFAIIGGDPS